jgi:uncharacterized membrane protein
VVIFLLTLISVLGFATGQYFVYHKRLLLAYSALVVASLFSTLTNVVIISNDSNNAGLILFCILNLWICSTSIIGFAREIRVK